MVYDPDCNTDSIVTVNGKRLPAGSVDIYMRKEGPVDFARYCEGTFASPFNGEDFTDHFDGLDEEKQDSWDTLTVRLRPQNNEEDPLPRLVFHGFVTGVGNSSGPEKEWHFRAQGPGMFLDKVAASKNFEEPTVREVIEYCSNRLDSRFNGYTVQVQAPSEAVEPQDQVSPSEIFFSNTGKYLYTSKSFQRNKHTLSDVLNWLRDKMGLRIWLTPTQTGALLFASDRATDLQHKATYLGGDVQIHNNDALVELNPINTLILKGKAKKSITSIGDFDINTPSAKYWTAKVRHDPLYQRAGQNEYLADVDTPSDAQSQIEVVNEAKSLLKEKVDEATGGDMETLLAPSIEPFHTIKAKPTCDSSSATSTPPTTYEVSRVHHKVRPGELSVTNLNVGVRTSIQEDITTARSWLEDK